jgi:hypothetical protein
MNISILGEMPLLQAMSRMSDAGVPAFLGEPDVKSIMCDVAHSVWNSIAQPLQ